jgi:hypothetical protein
MKYEIEHACYRVKAGGWVAQFHINYVEGSTLHSQQCFDPRTDLFFATEEEAKERNRVLACIWRDANCPDAELVERLTETELRKESKGPGGLGGEASSDWR